MSYPDYIYQQITGNEPLSTLRDTLVVANNILAQGAPRTGPERQIPLCVWYSEGFEAWYKGTKEEDSVELADAKVHWLWPTNGKWPAERFGIDIMWKNLDGSTYTKYYSFLDRGKTADEIVVRVDPEFLTKREK